MRARSVASSICQGRLVVTLRPSTTGPATPKQAASILSRRGEARKRATASSSDGNSRLERSEEHTSELQSRLHLVCRLLLEKKKYRGKLLLPRLPQALDSHTQYD